MFCLLHGVSPKGGSLFFSLRGPGGSIGCLGTFFGVALFSRVPRPFHSCSDKWIGAKVVGYSTHLGSYGMGGCGFLGVEIEKSGSPKWLLFPLWGAAGWITINDKIIEEELTPDEKKLYSNERVISIDKTLGFTTTEFSYTDDWLTRLL